MRSPRTTDDVNGCLRSVGFKLSMSGAQQGGWLGSNHNHGRGISDSACQWGRWDIVFLQVLLLTISIPTYTDARIESPHGARAACRLVVVANGRQTNA